MECILLHIEVPAENYLDVDAAMTKRLRGSDYMGIMTAGGLYVLLANTTRESAAPVQERFKENGYQTEIVE